MTCSNILVVEDLAKRFGNDIAVDDLSFSVNRGTIHGLVGPNGAGKTTTIEMCVGLLRPDKGSITAFGETLGVSRTQKSRIGYMPEVPSYPGYLTATELLGTYAGLFGMGANGRPARIREVLEVVGLAEHAGNRIGTYTKGMKQRVGLAQALLLHPDLVILDEPSMGLDPLGMAEFRGLIKSLRDEEVITVFLSSHLLHEVQQLCDHATIINRGTRVASGTIQEISSELAGKSTVEIEIPQMSEAVIRAIKNLTFVERMETNGTKITVRLNTNDDVRSQISRTVVEAGGIILSMQIAGGSLEDAFIRLMEADNGNSGRENAS